VKRLSAYDRLRQRLVLTAEEKRVILFAVFMFLLGLGAKYYRDTHSPDPRAAQTEVR
jgi:multisubunit Na+/H+ antiporter MnhC subunit